MSSTGTRRVKDGNFHQTNIAILYGFRPKEGAAKGGPGGWPGSSNTHSLVQKAKWARLWPFLSQSAFCVVALCCLPVPSQRAVNVCVFCTVARSGWLIRQYFQMSKITYVHLFNYVCIHYVTDVYLNVCQTEHLFVRACTYVCARICMCELPLPLPWGAWMWVTKHLDTPQKCLDCTTHRHFPGCFTVSCLTLRD